jgi:hypothetical protein
MLEALKPDSLPCAWIMGCLGLRTFLGLGVFHLVLRRGHSVFHLGSARLRGLLVELRLIALAAARQSQQAKTQ